MFALKTCERQPFAAVANSGGSNFRTERKRQGGENETRSCHARLRSAANVNAGICTVKYAIRALPGNCNLTMERNRVLHGSLKIPRGPGRACRARRVVVPLL